MKAVRPIRDRVVLCALICASLAALCMPLRAGSGDETPRQAPAARPASEFPSLEALEGEVTRLVDTAGRSVVGIVGQGGIEGLLAALGDQIEIEGMDEKPNGALARRVGSGVVIDRQGHIVTLSSVVSGSTEVTVIGSEGSKIAASVRGIDEETGLAVLETKGGTWEPALLGDSTDLRIGSLITALGRPQGASPIFSLGFVLGTGMSEGPMRRGSYLKLSAYSAPGAGGGPVFDRKGRFVGLIFGAQGSATQRSDPLVVWERSMPHDDSGGTTPEAEGEESDLSWRILGALHRAGAAGGQVSYAIPGNVVRRVSEQIIRSGAVKRGWIGINFEESEPGDLRLVKIIPGSPAEKAGLTAGDRIISINGDPLKMPVIQIDEAVSWPPGTSVQIGIQRGDKLLNLPVLLGEGPRSPRLHFIGMPPPGRSLGIKVEDIEDEQRARLGAPAGQGMLIKLVYEGSRAESAGLLPGDLIIEALGRPVGNIHDLWRAREEQGADQEMPIKVLRGGQPVMLRLAPAPEAPPPPAQAPPAPRPPRRRP
jgi:serine protease Do